MSRKRFSERMVLETLLHRGYKLRCYRSKEPITLENVATVEREHLIPIGLNGPDSPENCAYSLKEAHKRQTHGRKGTGAGWSDLRMIRKAKDGEERRLGLKKEKPKKRIPSRPFQKRLTKA